MNSSNGKHAQRPEQTELKQGIGEGTIRSRILDLWEVPAPAKQNFNKNPYITALTTVYGRYTLWEKGTEIINKGGRLCYCDTDSWFYLGDGIESGKGINDWAAEDDDGDVHIFAGRKIWASPEIFKVKGLRQIDADGKPLTYADFQNLLKVGYLTKKVTQFEKFRTMSRKGRETVAVADVEKTISIDEDLEFGWQPNEFYDEKKYL